MKASAACSLNRGWGCGYGKDLKWQHRVLSVQSVPGFHGQCISSPPDILFGEEGVGRWRSVYTWSLLCVCLTKFKYLVACRVSDQSVLTGMCDQRLPSHPLPRQEKDTSRHFTVCKMDTFCVLSSTGSFCVTFFCINILSFIPVPVGLGCNFLLNSRFI